MAKNKKHTSSKSLLPFVSICTPTFNRRPFIPMMLQCFAHQTYPKDRMEWIIIDDGTDKIGDLVKDVPEVKYFAYDEKMTLGKKRNLMHDKTKGDIIVYMDDDDYYPPTRVSHAVETLQKNPNALCAGSSEMYIYFKHIQQMKQFGPYGPNHSTAATFAFRRSLLSKTRYDETAALAEERDFLKQYTIPFVQLDPTQVILVFSHNHNSFDKKTLLENKNDPFIKETTKKVADFVKEPTILRFFLEDIDAQLEAYDPGHPKHKPDVQKQIVELKEKREKMMADHQQQQQAMMQNPQIQALAQQIMQLRNNLQQVSMENQTLKEKNAYLEAKIKEVIQKQIHSHFLKK